MHWAHLEPASMCGAHWSSLLPNGEHFGMTTNTHSPASILVFGAAGHIGGPLVEWVAARAPGTKLRLVTSSQAKQPSLQEGHPGAEVVVANYYDLSSLVAAFKGIEACFVVTPDFLDEQQAMTNVAAAARDAGSLKHLVRLIGDPPGLDREEHVPKELRDFEGGTAVQHLCARKALEDSGLPVTYLNIAAWFMDDFATFLLPPVLAKRKLWMPYDRWMNFIDCRDIGRAAAELLLSGDPNHHHKTYNLDNGVDLMRFSDVAPLMSEVLGVEVTYDDSPETFLEELGEIFRLYMGRGEAPNYFLRYCEWERGNETLARQTDIMGKMLGLTPRTFRQWLAEHQDVFLGAPVAH
jgi:uncharacterized protein YbjT (DUF2867 family)